MFRNRGYLDPQDEIVVLVRLLRRLRNKVFLKDYIGQARAVSVDSNSSDFFVRALLGAGADKAFWEKHTLDYVNELWSMKNQGSADRVLKMLVEEGIRHDLLHVACALGNL